MGNIYNISGWTANTAYPKNSIVSFQGLYYYAKVDFVSAASFSQNDWYGYTIDNGQSVPNFPWRPSYNPTVQDEPRIKSIKFGDGYEQILPDGINNDLLVLNLDFDGRDDNETAAILHFLYARQGWQSFIFTPPLPYNIPLRFRCKTWNSVYVFANNHNIKIKFDQSVV